MCSAYNFTLSVITLLLFLFRFSLFTEIMTTVCGSMHVDGRIHIVCQAIRISTIQEEVRQLDVALVMPVVVVLEVVVDAEVVEVAEDVVVVEVVEDVVDVEDVEARNVCFRYYYL